MLARRLHPAAFVASLVALACVTQICHGQLGNVVNVNVPNNTPGAASNSGGNIAIGSGGDSTAPAGATATLDVGLGGKNASEPPMSTASVVVVTPTKTMLVGPTGQKSILSTDESGALPRAMGDGALTMGFTAVGLSVAMLIWL
ncbi:hypothetical protein THASP1DRAFT_25894 [Thamnocephalis sphaerospora]|uniref:Uncharacterized protein n=1 Tax=Thamnocephalis sphaerospora TaxID=78915 RepID=A0A4P9XJT4_9FUNG|nr:hypothetical protein THASP1DRAFT_25894 [Thamnocephalis sphaerospora]|eukprot:RKP05641.1 hypothetical protein THASP1DRAFT_25894 [Thamnocephalis sphaerospora]